MSIALALLSVLSAAPAASTDFFLCELDDGVVHIADAAHKLPANCPAVKTTLDDVEVRPIDPKQQAKRNEAIDALVERARVRRLLEEDTREAWVADVRDHTRALISARMALDETHDRLASERWRWAAFMPGQWIILFADKKHVARLERREAFLEADVERLIDALEALAVRARVDRIPPRIVDDELPDLTQRPTEPSPPVEGFGF